MIQITWTDALDKRLAELYRKYQYDLDKWGIIAEELGTTRESARSHYRMYHGEITGLVQQSPYPRYNAPLAMEGDALVLPDVELPFHDADFINCVLGIAEAWGIKQCIMAGDLLHLDSLSAWEPAWQNETKRGGLDEKQEAAFMEFAKGLGSRQQARAMSLLESIGHPEADGDPNISEEMRVARSVVNRLATRFDKVDCLLGNHEGRFLKSLKSPLFPSEITRLIDRQDWRIAPYYFGFLVSDGVEFRIEHPRSAAKSAAITLASKYQTNVLMAHSHYMAFDWDISGRFYAIQMGHCVDEKRLPYASQRSSVAPAHKLGAVIVRDGYPYLLHEGSPWDMLARMA